MYAVVEISGKQYTVSPSQKVEVEHIDGAPGDTITFPRVLLTHDDSGKTAIGTPTVKGIALKARIVSQSKGKKLSVGRYKSKVRYRKHTGFRAHLTELEILTIGAS